LQISGFTLLFCNFTPQANPLNGKEQSAKGFVSDLLFHFLLFFHF